MEVPVCKQPPAAGRKRTSRLTLTRVRKYSVWQNANAVGKREVRSETGYNSGSCLVSWAASYTVLAPLQCMEILVALWRLVPILFVDGFGVWSIVMVWENLGEGK